MSCIILDCEIGFLRLLTVFGSETSACNLMLDQLGPEKSTRDCPKSPRRMRRAVHLACCVASTSSKRRVPLLLRFLQRRKKSCPSLQRPPMLVKINGTQKFSLIKRPDASLRGYASAFSLRALSLSLVSRVPTSQPQTP